MATTRPIFRHIEIARGRRIVLGEPFTLHKLSVPSGPDERDLLPHVFGGAESIVIELTHAGVVRAMRFRYASGTALQPMVNGYKEMLGAPAVEEPEELVWHDAATGFELRLDTSSAPAALRSRLFDRQLGG